MAVFHVERNTGYTVMSNHHLRNKELTLKAKGLLSQMLSLPEDWDYTLAGLSYINREKIDAIREAVRELERTGYIQRSRERDKKGRLRGADYIIYEQPPNLDLPTLENPTLENPTQEKPTLENPMQLNKDIQKTDLSKKEKSNLFDKIGQAVRFSPGADLSGKVLSLADGFSAAFANPLPSLVPMDLLIGIVGAVLIRLMVYFKGKNAKKYRKGIEYGSARWSA